MDSRNVLLPTLATLLAGLLMTAPAMAQEGRGDQDKVNDAAISRALLGAQLVFGVQGLTKDNAEKVTQGLTSLTETVYACSGCEHMAATAGNCSKCGIPLEAKMEPILSEALLSLTEASIRLTPFAARTLSYTALEGVLTKNSIEIDDTRFPLAGESRLVVRKGVLADVKAIKKALDAAGLFERVKASYDAESAEIHVVVKALSTPPMHESVAAVIDALDTNATLVDVVWGPQSSVTKI